MLNFSDEDFKEVALDIKQTNYVNNISQYDAFLIVLNGLDYQTIDNLCEHIGDKINKDAKIAYNLIQSGLMTDDMKMLILDSAYEIIEHGKELGNKITDKNYNASSWIKHSLFEGKVASTLAESINLNGDTAMKLGLLHDVGRKFDHSFSHTIKGFEYLTNMGLYDEAVICLTHSFLPTLETNFKRGNRCANCDKALEGFYVDDAGHGVFKDDAKLDDITLFLNNYSYNLYDMIINIADLMASSRGVMEPYNRILDVYTRKEPDDVNSDYFKVCFINVMRRMIYMITKYKAFEKSYNYNDIDSSAILERILKDTSYGLYTEYDIIKQVEQEREMRVVS